MTTVMMSWVKNSPLRLPDSASVRKESSHGRGRPGRRPAPPEAALARTPGREATLVIKDVSGDGMLTMTSLA